jgi:two-component system OmpR family sensor kinase/two-component system sensor histidine kinase QseC
LPTAGLPEEVAPMVTALNALLDRLGRSFDTQRAFVADAAHELRSPLTALKLQMTRLERARDDSVRAEATAALSAGIERAAHLVEQLLALARTEPGAPPPALASVDLAELARSALADCAPLATSQGSTLELRADAPVPLQGHAASLVLLVRNLVDNALRYAGPGATVQVRVAQQEGAPVLTVDDSGPGIPVAERERVFDRFYRRADAVAPGSGLGLALVKSVAERHGARVLLSDSPLGGLRATVRFGPAA